MREVFPNYYDKFKCIGGNCKHSCCIGWEIDVDDETMDFYNSLDGEFADRILQNIEGEVPHFVLREGNRCPFLNQDGLCDIICEFGEDALCDICYLHPRFTNCYDGFTETGLGLCCEEAARIILTDEEKFSLPLPTDIKNDVFFTERQAVFDILQDRNDVFSLRLKKLADKYGLAFNFSNAAIYDLYASLERLDYKWDEHLKKLKRSDCILAFEREDLQIFFEQLACYFVFRHFENGVGFAILSCLVIGAICGSCENFSEMIDVVRQYSSEVEYCEENTQKVIDFLK